MQKIKLIFFTEKLKKKGGVYSMSECLRKKKRIYDLADNKPLIIIFSL